MLLTKLTEKINGNSQSVDEVCLEA